jgi:CheY-like chemotaxis protein
VSLPDPEIDTMMLRSDHPANREEARRDGRLNLLLSYGGWRDTPTVEQLAHLLEPLGIRSVTADSGEQAAEIIRQLTIHIAIVDLAIPLHRDEPTAVRARPGGGRILKLLRRLHPAPPTVIVRPPQPAARENARGLTEALREGAFAVVDRPVDVETMLEIMRRVLIRHYAGHWPDA